MTVAKLIYLMGPSGSGKDSLISALRQQPQHGLMFAHRYVTRPWQSGNENHIELTDSEFELRRQSGLFCLDWQANGHQYSVGCEVLAWLVAGHPVLMNGSREHLSQAMEVFGEQLLPVMIRVNENRLRERLLQRGRETSELIEARLERSRRLLETIPDRCHFIDNNGKLEDAILQFSHVLDQLCESLNHVEN